MPFNSYLLKDALFRFTVDMPEREYYKAPNKLPDPPKPGFVLLTRRPLSQAFRVMWSEGQTITIMGDDPDVIKKLRSYGLREEAAERALQHIWNFGKAYVKLLEGYPDSPPVKMPTSLLGSRLPLTPREG